MNYFELFEIPVQFLVNKDEMQQKFYALSKKYHPDFYVFASAEERNNAEIITTQLNTAYKTLTHLDLNIAYVLRLLGYMEQDEKYNLSPDFLMDMMDINEQVADMDAAQNELKEALLEQLLQQQQQLLDEVMVWLTDYTNTLADKAKMLAIKDFYYKRKYVQRILSGLNGDSTQ